MIETTPARDYSNSLGFERPLNVPAFPLIDKSYLPDNVMVHFHFAPHAVPEHLEGLKTLLPGADIVVPEISSWDERDVKVYNAISRGDRKILNRAIAQPNVIQEWYEERFKAIFGTYKPVLFIDRSAAQKGLSMTAEGSRHVFAEPAKPTIGDTLHAYADTLAEANRRSVLRDHIMVGNLGAKVTELVTRHPRLRNQSEVNALVSLGFAHQGIYKYLQEQPTTHNNVVASVWSGMQSMAIEDEVSLAYIEGKAPTRNQLIELMITHAFATVPSFVDQGKPMYQPLRNYKRQPDAEQLVVKATIDLMKGNEEGQLLAFDKLRNAFTLEKARRFMAYIEEANQLVFKSTGLHINTRD